MKNGVRFSLLCLLLINLCTGCRRELLTEEVTTNYAEIGIEIDWHRAGINPDDATLLLYREGEPAPVTHILQSGHEVVRMKEGRYSMIVFNQKIGDFDAIDFRGVDQYATIQAFAKPIPSRGSKQAQGLWVDNPDSGLAVASLDEFVVTPHLVEQTRVAISQSRASGTRAPVHTLRFEPLICVNNVKVMVYTRGLNNVRKETARGAIDGFAESIYLRTQRPTNIPAVQFLEFTNIAFDAGSTTDGYMEGYVTTFGRRESIDGVSPPVALTVDATLKDVDKTPFHHESNVTELIEDAPEVEIQLKIEVEVKVPDVVPEGGGFDPTIPGWGDDEVVEK